MVSKKLISGLFGLFFSLNFGLYGVATNLPTVSDINICPDTNLSSCLNLIHRYHSQSLVAIKRDELAKMKRVTTDAFLMGLAIPEGSLKDSLSPKIQELLKSGDSDQKEAAITSISYLMFDYKSDIEITSSEVNKVHFDRISELFLHEQKLFLKLCIDLINNSDTDTNVCRACYEFFIQYFCKSEDDFEAFDLNNVVEVGLKSYDRFIHICALVLKEFTASDLSDDDFVMFKSNFNTTDFLIAMRSKIRKLSRCGCGNYFKETWQFRKNLKERGIKFTLKPVPKHMCQY